MRKLLIIASLLAMTVPAVAQEHRHHPEPQRRPYGHDGRNILPWVAGATALGALGLGSTYWYNTQHRKCWDEMVGYDRWGNEVWKRYCN